MPTSQEMPQFERKREPTDRSVLRMAREEEELMQALGKMKERGEVSDEDISAHVESLAKRHDIERTTGVPFVSDDAFEEFERHAGGAENSFAPDLELPLDQGKVYRHDRQDWVYMGVNEEGKRVLRREGETTGTIEEYELEEHEARELLNQSDESLSGGESAPEDNPTTTVHESSAHPASAPPPPEIESVSAPADPQERSASQSEISEGAKRLNALKGEIDAQYAILNETKETKGENVQDKKRYDKAHRELRTLYKEAKDEAIRLVGGEALAALVKTADDVLLRKNKDPKTLAKEEQDAYYDAVRRRESFIRLLEAQKVERKIAGDLYRRALTHATDLDQLAKALEGGNVDALKEGRARGALEWHDVPMRRPDQATAVLGDILPIVEQYRATPPHEERQKKAVEEKRERKRPIEILLESLASSDQEIDDRVLHSFLKDKGARITPEERVKLEDELEARKAKRKAARMTASGGGDAGGGENTERRPSVRDNVIQAVVNYKDGDSLPPKEILTKYSDAPEIQAFLAVHPELVPKTETKSTGRKWVKKTQEPTPVPLSGKALADAIEAGKPLGVVAEEPWEIAAASRRSKPSAVPEEKGTPEDSLKTHIAILKDVRYKSPEEVAGSLTALADAIAKDPAVVSLLPPDVKGLLDAWLLRSQSAATGTGDERDESHMEGEMGPQGVSGFTGEVASAPAETVSNTAENPATASGGAEALLTEAGGYKVGEIVTWRSPTGTDYPDLTITGFSPDGAYVFTDVSGTGLPIAEIFRSETKNVPEAGEGADEPPVLSQEELRAMIERYEAKADRTPDDERELAELKEIYRLAGGTLPDLPPTPLTTPEEGNVVPIPSLEGGASPESTRKIFDPEKELAAILQLPKAERRGRLGEYKVKLAWQRKGLARTQAMVVEAIRKNPDMTEQEFDKLFGAEAEKFEVSDEQCIRALTVFGKYKRKHEAVEKYATQYPDPKDLYRVVFGIEALGSVEVVKGPMTLCFRLKNEDFVNIYSGKRYHGQSVSPETRKSAKLAGGFALSGSRVPELAGTLLVEKAGLINSAFGNPEGVRAHEEQHAINTLFQEELRIYGNRTQVMDAWKRIDFAATPEDLREGICKLLRTYRSEMEDEGRASDEIFAYLREGRSPKDILHTLMKSKLYDYFRNERERVKESVRSFRGDRFTKEEAKIYDEAAEQVFVEEYEERLIQGLKAYRELREMGFTEEGVRGVLLHEPLARWTKVVERLQEPGYALPEAVAKGFTERFGIDQQELLNIERFRNLSEGQQLLVLRNLEQMTLTEVKKEARDTQKEEWSKTPALKKIWKQLYSFGMNPEHRIAELEKSLLERVRAGEFAEGEEGAKALAKKLADIEALAKVAHEGRAVDVDEEGALTISYVSGKDLFDSEEDTAITPEHRRLFEEFNQAASTLAALPHEWGYDTKELSRKDRGRFFEAKDAYERARGNLSRLYRERFAEEGAKDPAASAMRAMNAIDERMQLNQLFNTHPDAETALQQIEDQNTIMAAAKEFWKSKGMFVAYGAAARAATVALVGTMPIVGAALAYVGGAGIAGAVGKRIGEAEAKRVFKEKRVEGRMSEEDLREEVSYEVYKTEPTMADGKPDGGNKRVFDAEGKPLVERVEKRKIKEYTDATFFIDRIERLVEKLNNTSDPAGRGLLEQKIAQTVALMHEKLEAGLINFGGSSVEENDERKGNVIANRLSFIQAMALGRAFVVVDNDNLEMEFSRMIKLHEAKIDDVRKKAIAQAGKKAALYRAGFALAGAALADGVRQIMHFGDLGVVKVPPQQSGGVVAAPQQPEGDIDIYHPDAFKPQYFDRSLTRIIGRPLSADELDALRSTGGLGDPSLADEYPHRALIIEMTETKVPLSKEEIANIIKYGEKAPSPERVAAAAASSPLFGPNEAPVPPAETPVTGVPSGTTIEDWKEPGPPDSSGMSVNDWKEPDSPALAPEQYHVRSGDNVTNILKKHIPELQQLSPRAQENAIQNLLKSLSPEEMRTIGLGADPDKIMPGQTIDLKRVGELLHEKKIGGINIIERAQQLNVPIVETPQFAPEGLSASAVSDQAGESAEAAEVDVEKLLHNKEGEALLRSPEGRHLWNELSEANKERYAALATPHHIEEDVGKIFVKGPLETWPKEWLALRERNAAEFLAQNEQTESHLLPKGKVHPLGEEWFVVEKMQKQIRAYGLTKENGFVPTEHETLEEFLRRALKERILRDGPIPWVK